MTPAPDRRGAVVFLTGLSGAGKSTIARALAEELRTTGGRANEGREVALLDGDEVPRHRSSDLGVDPASRTTNVERVAAIAAQVAARGGIAITALVAPFEVARQRARAIVEPHGAFVLVHVRVPLEVAEARDPKGLYARARAGEIPGFTGISSPFEEPRAADVTVDASTATVGEAVRAIRVALERAVSAPS